jgi:hypothetical protein
VSDSPDRYEENVVSWRTVWNDLYPHDQADWHDDEAAAEMHRLRGLTAAQAAETEDVLRQILYTLDPSADVARLTAGAMLKNITKILRQRGRGHYQQELDIVNAGIQRRNHTVHNSVTVGSSWVDYATGGAEYVPVISLMGDNPYDEAELRLDLALQHRATAAAVTVLRGLTFDELSDDNS